MYLLKFGSDDKLILTRFIASKIPSYAILSHTWEADDQEVTFKDLTDGVGISKLGYRKIRFCGEQAQKNDLQYFWVDSCCIDKSSSSELQEAINSMFRWYQNAARCYVYLTDVSTGEHSQLSQPLWHSAFSQSRWFTRGWTLQELLAPSSVEFFSREGKRLGDKKSLEVQIHHITGIAVRAIRANSLSEFSIDERMSWAANRITTIDEDQAYCLLGIFEIYLPLIYGEGKANAFRRLRKEIRESGNDSLNLLPYASALRQHEKSEQGTLEHPLLHSLAGHREYVRCIAFSLDGKLLASGSGDCTVRLWDVATGSTLQELEGHIALVEGVAFSPDGKRLASASEDGSVRLWDVATGSALQTLGDAVLSSTNRFILERVVYQVAFSPDGKRLASGQWNGMVRLWDVGTGSALQTLQNEGYVSDIAFSPDGKRLASASGGGNIKLWEVAEKVRESALQTLEGHDRYVRKVTFSPDSKRLASAGADGTIRLWDVETGAMLQMMLGDDITGRWDSFIGTKETVTVQDVVFSGDGKQMASASENGTIRRWDITREAREVRESTIGMHKGTHSVVLFSPDLKRLASMEGSALTIQLWDAVGVRTCIDHGMAVVSDGKSADLLLQI